MTISNAYTDRVASQIMTQLLTGTKRSHVSWIGYHVGKALQGATQSELAEVCGVSNQSLRRARDGAVCSLGTIECIANGLDMSISEIMLSPTVDTEPYKTAKLAYLPDNLSKRFRDVAKTPRVVGQELHTTAWAIRNYLGIGSKNNPPRTEMLQTIADYLDTEVADLFLPPEGGDEP